MLRNLRPIISLLAGTALLLLGMGLLTTLIPLRGGALGFSTTMLGALTSAYYVGYFVGTFALPPLIQRIGHIRAFAFCTAAVACLVLLHTLSDNPWFWLLLRLFAGISLVGLYAIIESWLNAQTEARRRGSVFAIYMMVNLGSLAQAQQLLRIQGEPFVLFVVVALLVCAAALPVVATRQTDATGPETGTSTRIEAPVCADPHRRRRCTADRPCDGRLLGFAACIRPRTRF